ncbi:hypothetical protein K440DRAFT_640449 [Wilcoxina mikolae CBS 423.85]|nr:hypothetical protein K440DRAFT_640449 [Wilcoxina mikolae CBS 423.85]
MHGGLRPPPLPPVPAAVNNSDRHQGENNGSTSAPPSPASTLVPDHGSDHQDDAIGSSFRLPDMGVPLGGVPGQPIPQDISRPPHPSPATGQGFDNPQGVAGSSTSRPRLTRAGPSVTGSRQIPPQGHNACKTAPVTAPLKQKYNSLIEEADKDNEEPPGPLPRNYDRHQDPEVRRNTYDNERIDVPTPELPAPRPAGESTNREVNINPTAEVQDPDGGISVTAIDNVDDTPESPPRRPTWHRIRSMSSRWNGADEESRLRSRERRRQRLAAIRDRVVNMQQQFRSTVGGIFRRRRTTIDDRHAFAGHPENPEEKNPLIDQNPLNREPSPLQI